MEHDTRHLTPGLRLNNINREGIDVGRYIAFRRLRIKLCPNGQQISEIPPGPPLTKGGWGDFRGIRPQPNMPF